MSRLKRPDQERKKQERKKERKEAKKRKKRSRLKENITGITCEVIICMDYAQNTFCEALCEHTNKPGGSIESD